MSDIPNDQRVSSPAPSAPLPVVVIRSPAVTDTDLLASHRHQPKVRHHALPQLKSHPSVLLSLVIARPPRKIPTYLLSTAPKTTLQVSASHSPASLVVLVALARVAMFAPPQTRSFVLLILVPAQLICFLIRTCPTHPRSHPFLPY
jgi:hypothetical protein